MGDLNRFLFGSFGLFYPFVLLFLNFIFYKRGYDFDRVKRSEIIGLSIAFVCAALLFAILGEEAGYIPEVLYAIFGFVFGRLLTGFLSLFLLLFSIALIFPRFVELVFGIRINYEIFVSIEDKIKQFLYGFFGGKEEFKFNEAKEEPINTKSEEKASIFQENPLNLTSANKQEYKNPLNLTNAAKQEYKNPLNLTNTVKQEDKEPLNSQSKEDLNLSSNKELEIQNLKELSKPKQSPDQIAARLAAEFDQNQEEALLEEKDTQKEQAETKKEELDNSELLIKDYRDKKLETFITKASAEFDEYFDKFNNNAPKEAFVPEIFLRPKRAEELEIQRELNFDQPSYQRKNIDIAKEERSNLEEETPIKEEEKFTFEVRELNEDQGEALKKEVKKEAELPRAEFSKKEELSIEEENTEEIIKENSSLQEEKPIRVAMPKFLEENANLLNSLERGNLEPPKDFKLPPLDFLVRPSGTSAEVNEQEIDKKIYDLLEKLRRFKIGGDVISTYTGPVVTTFEFRPSADVKVSRILSLQDDLAMALRATSIRIQAPIPGKDVVGIEVPNEQIQTIYLREILESEVFKGAKSPLTIALGKDIVGNAFVTDLKKLPHLLIAGTTGSGKSVGINAMLLSLLYRNSPKNLRLMMIDPKMLEFSIYNDIPHLLTPVITDPKKAIIALSNMVAEMERRYKLMAEARTKNIENYNEKCAELEAEPLPFIVVIIDELADLMMTAGKDVEFYIGRLAQMARASGIHLIVATQRPSVDVVTGLIKANLPSRLAYKVGQRIDSKVILDTQGAESLLGRGDSLFTPPGTSNIVRLHAPFASEMEIEKIVEFLKAQQVVEYDENFLKDGSSNGNMASSSGENLGEDGLDELIEQAKAVILEDKKTSISYLQRRLKIGYNRAANIIEQLAQMGVLSEPDAKGQREILM
ncbi:cell division protein FtsK [Campylobacter troglodytis]|nr:DNA translocase FtsK [Campylobacter troglodytis]TQR60559.1 cell division protein FtsK [Campylobacter troglodytis]